MLEITIGSDDVIALAGRFDAAQADRAQTFLDGVVKLRVIDCARLEYVSSAGLGVLLRTHKRVLADGGGLELINVNHHIADIFRYSALDRVFRIQPAPQA